MLLRKCSKSQCLLYQRSSQVEGLHITISPSSPKTKQIGLAQAASKTRLGSQRRSDFPKVPFVKPVQVPLASTSLHKVRTSLGAAQDHTALECLDAEAILSNSARPA